MSHPPGVAPTEQHEDDSTLSGSSRRSTVGPVIREPNPSDICLGRGRSHTNHPGNQLLSATIGKYSKEYDGAKLRNEKTKITQQIVEIVGKTGRFLSFEEKLGGWVEISNEQSRKRVAQLLRNRRLPKYVALHSRPNVNSDTGHDDVVGAERGPGKTPIFSAFGTAALDTSRPVPPSATALAVARSAAVAAAIGAVPGEPMLPQIDSFPNVEAALLQRGALPTAGAMLQATSLPPYLTEATEQPRATAGAEVAERPAKRSRTTEAAGPGNSRLLGLIESLDVRSLQQEEVALLDLNFGVLDALQTKIRLVDELVMRTKAAKQEQDRILAIERAIENQEIPGETIRQLTLAGYTTLLDANRSFPPL